MSTYKITVTRTDGTIDDITDYIETGWFENAAAGEIGSFSFTIPNPNEEYTGIWTGNNIVKVYMDYGGNATTGRFRGPIDKVRPHENKITIIGRGDGSHFMNRTVTKNYINQTGDIILKDLINTYGEGKFTHTNVAVSSITMSPNWYQKPFWECVTAICTAIGADCYIDFDLDFHLFEAESVDNPEEAVVHTSNLISVSDFAEDLSQMRNRIIVYGAEVDGIQILYTAESEESHTTYGLWNEEIVNDKNITSYDQAKEVGDYYLVQKKDPPLVGEVTAGLHLPSLQPAERIRISSPEDGLYLDYYKCVSYKFEFGEKIQAVVKINKDPKNVSQVLRGIIQRANESKDTSSNPHEMRFSFPFFFDVDTGTHSNTEISDGELKLASGESSGNWISPTRRSQNDITEVHLISIGEVLGGATYEASGDGGDHWEPIARGGRIGLVTSIGRKLKLKVTFTDANTKIDSLNALYKSY